jgi:membrane peptidoglycan carboxypeptidase
VSKLKAWQWIVITLSVLVVGGIIYVGYLYVTLPKISNISDIQVAQSTKIYDRTGTILLYEIHGDENRTSIPSEQIPDVIKQATVAIEDNNFYTSPVFDWRGILRALFADVTTLHFNQGGSTITQQLVKNVLLTSQKTLNRKIQELILAWQIERNYSKDQILTLYLNQIPYGQGAYGIEAASELYFGVPASSLTLEQASLLAAIPQAPTYYSPWGAHVSDLKTRWKSVLQAMYSSGDITEAQLTYAEANYPVVLPESAQGIHAPHFVTYVEDYLAQEYGDSLLSQGGLTVITSLDMNIQTDAEKAVSDGVARNTALYGARNAALVALDPTTGQILAMVGSADYFDNSNDGQFNVITQGLRQPGSSIKPFVYLTAFQQGLTPDTIVWNVPTEFTTNNPSCPAVVNFNNINKACYHPVNFEGTFTGPMTLAQALAQSVNVPAVQVLYLAGLNNVIPNLESFGISTITDPAQVGLSLVLGGADVKPIELAQAYGVLATEGVKHTLAPILKVTDSNGNVLYQYADQSSQVVDPQYPRLINNILADPSLRAPLFGQSLSLTEVQGHQVALKTGTTNNYVDAWAVGYTPNFVGLVWAGNNDNTPLTSQGSSILAAVPMWHEFMTAALQNYPLLTFNKPAPIYETNPILKGQLIAGQQHSILYYLGRVNDPEYVNWETAVGSWLENNTFNPSNFTVVSSSTPVTYSASSNNNSTSTPNSTIQIQTTSPSNGDFISNQININSVITSTLHISKVEVYLNSNLIDSKVGDLGTNYTYNSTLTPQGINLQNMLVIRVTDSSGAQTTEQFILFQK